MAEALLPPITMLPKLNRLKKKKDFEAVFKKGKSFKNSFLVLKITPNKLEISRFGLIVSQKVSKKAVIRNKVRRRLSEIIRKKMKETCLPAGRVKNGQDMVLIALPGLENKSFLETEEILTDILDKARLTI